MEAWLITRDSNRSAPLARLLKAHGIRRVEVAAAASVGMKMVHRLCRGRYQGLKLKAVCRVALALGVAPAELVPGLAAQPLRGGLIGYRRQPNRHGRM